MTKLNNLIKQAKSSCSFRSHIMSRFSIFVEGNKRVAASSKCTVCRKEVQCNVKLMPNDIEIGGEAVAVNCIRHNFIRIY